MNRDNVSKRLESLRDKLPHDQRTAFKPVISKLLEEFDSPNLAQFNSKLSSKVLDEGAYRRSLFYPDDEDAGIYVELMETCKEGEDVAVLIPFMVMLYLHHTYSNGSFAFSKSFILLGGLLPLSSLCSHPNLHLRGQAVDTVLQMTSHEDFDWFNPVPQDDEEERKTCIELHRKLLELTKPSTRFLSALMLNSPTGATFPGGSYLSLQVLAFWLSWVRALHTRGNALYLHPKLSHCLKAWTECDIYDFKKSGAGEEPKNGAIMEEEKKLATKVYEDFKRFDGLHEFDEQEEEELIHGQNEGVDDDFKGALPASDEDKQDDDEEVEEVAKRREDQPQFIQVDTFEGRKEGYVFGMGEGGEVGYSWDNAREKEVERKKTAKKAKKNTPPSPPPNPEKIFMKPPEAPKPLNDRERGNQCFVKGNYGEALKFYGKALVSGEKIDLDDIDGGEEDAVSQNDNVNPYSSSVTISEVVEKDAKAILHCNRAACYLKLVQGLWMLKQGELTWEDVEEEDLRNDNGKKDDGLATLRLAESEGRASIRFDGEYVKGYFRTGQALALQGKLKDALKIAKEGIKIAPIGDKSVDALDEFCGTVLSKIHAIKKAERKEAAQSEANDVAAKIEEDEVDKEAKIMAKILGRRNWGEKLKKEQKKVFENESSAKGAGEDNGEGEKIEEKKEEDEGNGDDVIQGKEVKESQALVVAKKNRRKTYEDDMDSGEEEEDEPFDAYGNRKPQKSKKGDFEELDGPDSDDDDTPARRSESRKNQIDTAPLPPTVPAEDVKFISNKNKEAMIGVLSMGKESKGAIIGEKDGKRKKKTKTTRKGGKTRKKQDGELSEIMKLGKVKVNDDFL